MNQKQLWEKLAKQNARYYINSDKGRGITEEEFVRSGKEDVDRLIVNDEILMPLIDGVFLEIGCGNGRMTEFISHWAETTIGVDISGEMIKQGNERLNHCTGITLLETNGEVIPIPNNYVDIAFSYLVFQHFKTKEMVENNFHEVRRVLKHHGIFKVRLRTDELDSLEPWWSGVHYSEQEIRELCERTKLKILDLEYVEHYGIWIWAKK